MSIPASVNIVENDLQGKKKISNESSSHVKLAISVLKYMNNLDLTRFSNINNFDINICLQLLYTDKERNKNIMHIFNNKQLFSINLDHIVPYIIKNKPENKEELLNTLNHKKKLLISMMKSQINATESQLDNSKIKKCDYDRKVSYINKKFQELIDNIEYQIKNIGGENDPLKLDIKLSDFNEHINLLDINSDLKQKDIQFVCDSQFSKSFKDFYLTEDKNSALLIQSGNFLSEIKFSNFSNKCNCIRIIGEKIPILKTISISENLNINLLGNSSINNVSLIDVKLQSKIFEKEFEILIEKTIYPFVSAYKFKDFQLIYLDITNQIKVWNTVNNKLTEITLSNGMERKEMKIIKFIWENKRLFVYYNKSNHVDVFENTKKDYDAISKNFEEIHFNLLYTIYTEKDSLYLNVAYLFSNFYILFDNKNFNFYIYENDKLISTVFIDTISKIYIGKPIFLENYNLFILHSQYSVEFYNVEDFMNQEKVKKVLYPIFELNLKSINNISGILC